MVPEDDGGNALEVPVLLRREQAGARAAASKPSMERRVGITVGIIRTGR